MARELYSKLDDVQFKLDYICVIMDKKKDYIRACKGFTINGIKYQRLLGTNGGIKNETIVFVAERNIDEIRRRIENNRNPDIPLVTAKLEAYKALTCSASIPVSMPKGILVVPDCETEFKDSVIYLSDENEGEPLMEYKENETIELDESDGYGIMLPSLSERWSDELKLGYMMSGCSIRYAFTKGMVFTFDFVDFADKVAGTYLVKDAWGNTVDIREIELVLTTSMVKLWDSYEDCESFFRNSTENKYTFGVTKICPMELESERTTNYQFIQPVDFSDSDVDALIKPTMDRIKETLGLDPIKSILFMRGMGLDENNVDSGPDDCIKALMIEPQLINDTYVQNKIYQSIKNRINRAKCGVLDVHGNYSIVSGDPYSLCQSIFGLEVTGLLKPREIYNKYWGERGVTELVCFRAPMSCLNNIRRVFPRYDEETRYWYQYMNTCTAFSSWSNESAALNGMDKDGDMVMLTDNEIFLSRLEDTPALMCMQRKAEKRISTDEDFIQSNIDSFGDDIGKTTNWITSMYEVRAKYPKDSKEYQVLDYRIRCGQHYQQNSIDKAKGIICKPMPKEWHDGHALIQIEDDETREFYRSILADKKPYFMRLVYPDLMREYNKYIKNTNKHAMRQFKLSVEELNKIPADKLTDEQVEFIKYYDRGLPVGISDCVMNQVCRKFENEFDGYIGKQNKSKEKFDYSILKSGVEYSRTQYNSIFKLYDLYNKRLQSFAIFVEVEKVDKDSAYNEIERIKEEFLTECIKVCQDRFVLCDIALDICYHKSGSKRFVWDICGEEIVENLLAKNNNKVVFPKKDLNGTISYSGNMFSLVEVEIERGNDYEFDIE